MKKYFLFSIILTALVLNGCTFVFQGGRHSDLQKIENLSKQVDELSQVKGILEKRLSQEIKDKNVRLNMMEKGLVITFVADILFDSGKDKIRQEAMPILDKVALVLEENIPEFKVGIEGHSDNEPIKVSGWKSNWELSTARALSVLHYLIDQKNIVPERLSAIGYGEYHPVSSNDSKEGRKFNRRVEIVILPKATKVKDAKNTQALKEPKENIK
ncbi:MAG: OmpA family protein [Candidatus Omnitrophota bacterium]|nr:OmpA family protein [Candidatus Omnitrophota bacterium]MBU1929602.1 OmpA family protein [Candidatus Omnitrophota bacterium]MBU2034795.1 OmpA family protein [Candidatus Omnitrophota bacterium]MBU2257857.1 OmpA family protein [Candidatus Omnitrophota bacterium]